MGQTRSTTRVHWTLSGQDGIDRAPMRIDCADPEAFRSRGIRWTFGDAIVSDSMHTPCRLSPSGAGLVDDEDYISVVFVLSGGYRIVDTDQSITLDKGSAGWFPGWTRVSGESPSTSRIARVSVLRESLLGAERGHQPVGRFDGPMMLTAPALAFVKELMRRADDAGPAADELCEGEGEGSDGGRGGAREHQAPEHPAAVVLSQLISGMFLEQRGYLADSAGSTSGLWAVAVALIDKQFRDPLLDPVSLAARLHISLRQLQRAFAQNGSTISDAIRDRRAEAAVALLAGSGGRDLSLGAVASANGFSSIKEMRYALRARHGMTPREFRSASTTAVLSANG